MVMALAAHEGAIRAKAAEFEEGYEPSFTGDPSLLVAAARFALEHLSLEDASRVDDDLAGAAALILLAMRAVADRRTRAALPRLERDP